MNADPTIVIRPLVAADIPRLLDVWREAGLSIRPTGRDSTPELMRQLAVNPDGFLGAFAGDTLLGAVIATDDGRRGWINRLAVSPTHRHRHLGVQLLNAAEKELRRRGLRIIAAHVEATNHSSRALLLYAGYKCLPEVQYFSKRDSDDV
jgi:ribosomal protein S18 acetylase RimI-like enzyme